MKHIDVFDNKHLSTEAVKNICNDLQRDRTEMLSIRNCRIADKDFKKVCKSVGVCRSLRHLALTVNVVCDGFRVQVLAQGLHKNTSLTGLHLHGNAITDNDMRSLYPHLHTGSRLSILDLSEGKLGDQGLDVVSCLLKEHKALLELTLSHNPNITTDGWSRFGMAIASGTGIRSLAIDYNDIGDTVACCFATALPGAQLLEFLDLECTGITDKAAQIFLHLVMSYNSKLKKINLKRNQVLKSTTEAIKLHLSTNNSPGRFITDDDEGSLTTSEPPISKHDYEYVQNDTSGGLSSFMEMDFVNDDIDNVECIPVVEVSPAIKDDRTFNDDAFDIGKSVRTNSMVEALSNNKLQFATELEDKRAFSLTDLRHDLPNEMTEDGGLAIKDENNKECKAYIPDIDAPEDHVCLAMSVQNVEDDDDDFDFESAQFESSSQHSIKGFDETDDTFKSDEPSPALYQSKEPETTEIDAQTDDGIQKGSKHIVVPTVENALPVQTNDTVNTTKAIEVRPMKVSEMTTKNNGTGNLINVTKPDVSLASMDNHSNKFQSSGPLVSKVICVSSKDDDKDKNPDSLVTKVMSVGSKADVKAITPGTLASQVMSVGSKADVTATTPGTLASKVMSVGSKADVTATTPGTLASQVMSVGSKADVTATTPGTLASKVMSVGSKVDKEDNKPDSLAFKVMNVDHKLNDKINHTKPATKAVESNIKGCDTYDNNIDVITLPSTFVEKKQESKDASAGGDIPKINRKRGKRNKAKGIDLAAAIRQNRSTSEA